MARHVVCAWKTVAGPVQSLSVREGHPITVATANTAIIIKDNYHYYCSWNDLYIIVHEMIYIIIIVDKISISTIVTCMHVYGSAKLYICPGLIVSSPSSK